MYDAIETHTFEQDGFDIAIYVVPDPDSNPFDADCYGDADIESWRNDEWHYVGFVYVARKAGVELGSASIWATEWGYPGGNMESIDDWIREDCYHPDLTAEAIADARATLARLV